MITTRRQLLQSVSLAAGALSVPSPVLAWAVGGRQLPGFYEEIERRTFNWFWTLASRKNGLVFDRWPTPSFASIAAVGFALPAYAIGVERGWCNRAAARDLTLTTLRFFWNAPQGPERTGRTGHAGFFYHFLDMETGLRYKDVELSSVDTTILLMGILFAGQYYAGSHPKEREIRRLVDLIYRRADWNFFRSDGRAPLSMGWHPEKGLIDRDWTGMNEGMFVNVLALGSPTQPAPSNLWQAWTKPYPDFWRGEGRNRWIAFAPLMPGQYSHIFIDFRGIRDDIMREAGFDYFENSRRETYANYRYCVSNPRGWRGYSREFWGLAACDGPGDFRLPYKGEPRQFYGYRARGPVGEPDGEDDGTLTSSAALGALPFAPEIVIPTAQAMTRRPGLFGTYGFKDAFNPTFTYDVSVDTGTIDRKNGWVAKDYLGIDQGPILLQAANFRDDFVWRYMRQVPAIRRGLKRAGFTGGWLG